jgi:hypothetical protein
VKWQILREDFFDWEGMRIYMRKTSASCV